MFKALADDLAKLKENVANALIIRSAVKMDDVSLKIDKIIPTVNVGSAKSRERMKAWCERWAAETRKNGLYKLPNDGSW